MKFHDIIYFYVNKSPSSIIFDWIYIRDNFNRQIRFPKLSKLVVFIFSNWSILFQKIPWRQNLKMHLDGLFVLLNH